MYLVPSSGRNIPGWRASCSSRCLRSVARRSRSVPSRSKMTARMVIQAPHRIGPPSWKCLTARASAARPGCILREVHPRRQPATEASDGVDSPSGVAAFCHVAWSRSDEGAATARIRVRPPNGCSRCLLGCQGLVETRFVETKVVFSRLFREYGLPERVRNENCIPFAPMALGRLSRPASGGSSSVPLLTPLACHPCLFSGCHPCCFLLSDWPIIADGCHQAA